MVSLVSIPGDIPDCECYFHWFIFEVHVAIELTL